jgi:hypothetical protein
MSSRSSIRRALAIATSVAVLSGSAAAQRMGAFEIGAFGGGYWGSQIYQGQIGGVGPIYNVGVNDAGLYGALIGYEVSRQFGFQFAWSASDPTLNFGSWGVGAPSGKLSVNNFDFDGMFMFGQQRVWGYFALGLGWAMYDASVTVPSGTPPPTSSKSWFAGNTALGMKFFMTPHIALQFDARYRWSNTGHNTGTGTSCSIYYYCYSYSSTWYGSSSLTGGITYVMFK